MEEEDVFLTPVVQSAFNFSPKKVRKYRAKSKNKTNSISEPKETENNENNDSEKTKKSGREVFPCGVCERNVGVNSKECGGCKKWTHFRCHAIYKGRGWGNEEDYRCPKCVHGLTGVFKKRVPIRRAGRKKGNLCTNEQNTNANAKKSKEDRRNAKRGLETEKEDNGETTKVKRHKNGKKYTEEEMEAYKKKLDDEHRRIIEEIHLNFLEERDRLIRGRDAEIEKEGENDILGNSVFRIEKTCIERRI